MFRVYFLNKVSEHLLSYVEIRDDTIFKWSDCCDVAWGPTKHAFCMQADRFNRFSTILVCTNGNHGGFVQNDTLPTYVDERIRRTQVDREIPGKQTSDILQHVVFL